MVMNKLIFWGLLAIAAIVSASDNEGDSNLSEELAPSRLVRTADARRENGKKARKVKEGKEERNGRKGKKKNNGRKEKKKRGRMEEESKKNGRKSHSGYRSSGESRQSNVLQGEHCQFIDFANARSSGSGCVDGTKMVVKNKPGHRKQFLIADSRTIYGFVEKGGKKFATDCSSYTDRTCDIQCKVENL